MTVAHYRQFKATLWRLRVHLRHGRLTSSQYWRLCRWVRSEHGETL